MTQEQWSLTKSQEKDYSAFNCSVVHSVERSVFYSTVMLLQKLELFIDVKYFLLHFRFHRSKMRSQEKRLKKARYVKKITNLDQNNLG